MNYSSQVEHLTSLVMRPEV